MGEFFRGWRRKMGCVTLAMALVFIGGWIRSFSLQGTFVIQIGRHSSVQFVSPYQRIILVKYETLLGTPVKRPFWISNPVQQDCWRLQIENMTSSPSLGVFLFGTQGIVFNSGLFNARFFELPYWCIVCPATVLSAIFLLTKPRNTTPKKIPEPVLAEGA